MNMFGRFFARTEPVFLIGDGSYEFSVEGDDEHQDALAQIAGSPRGDETSYQCFADVVFHKDGEFAGTTARVEVDGHVVAHLPRADAVVLRQSLSDFGYPDHPGRCKAEIRPRGEGSQTYTLRLDLNWPVTAIPSG